MSTMSDHDAQPHRIDTSAPTLTSMSVFFLLYPTLPNVPQPRFTRWWRGQPCSLDDSSLLAGPVVSSCCADPTATIWPQDHQQSWQASLNDAPPSLASVMSTIAPTHNIVQLHRASIRYVLLFLFYFYLMISSFSDVDNRTDAWHRWATPCQYQVCLFILFLFLPDDLQL